MILHGMVDTAGQASYSVSGLRKNHIAAELVVWEKNKFHYPCARCINEKSRNRYRRIWNEFLFGITAFFKYNIFHFHNATSLFPHALDLFFLALFHKKFVMEFHGSEVRWYCNRKRTKYWPEDLKEYNRREKVILERIFRYTDTVILHDDELRKYLPSNVKNVYIVPLRIDVTAFSPQYPIIRNTRPLIVHAPSNHALKGSKFVIRAIESLKQKYEFDFILVQNKSQADALELYKKADVIIDQLIIGTYGVFALEAMALGKPVICYVSDDMVNTFPESLPIVNATIDNIQEKIEQLLIDPVMRNQLGIQGRQYVEMYHDSEMIARLQMQIYAQEVEPLPSRESFEYVKNLRSV